MKTGQSLIAVFLSLLMTLEPVYAVSYNSPANASKFVLPLPSALGYVTESYAPPSASGTLPNVILIQNLHVNRSVQFAISGILRRLKALGLLPKSIAVEGATGPVDIASMQRYPDPQIRKEAADYLVQQGEMPGAMHFAVTEGHGSLFGIETDEFYQTNLDMFRQSYRTRTHLKHELDKIAAVLPRLKKDPTIRRNALILEQDVAVLDQLITSHVVREELPSLLKRGSAAVEHLKIVVPEKVAQTLVESVRASINFYALALIRDEELFKNALSVRELGQQKTTVIVTGGFHTKGLATQCKQKGLSYVVITPHVKRHDKVDEKLYLERLLGRHLTSQQLATGLDWTPQQEIEPPLNEAPPRFAPAVPGVLHSRHTGIRHWLRHVLTLILEKLGITTPQGIPLRPTISRGLAAGDPGPAFNLNDPKNYPDIFRQLIVADILSSLTEHEKRRLILGQADTSLGHSIRNRLTVIQKAIQQELSYEMLERLATMKGLEKGAWSFNRKTFEGNKDFFEGHSIKNADTFKALILNMVDYVSSTSGFFEEMSRLLNLNVTDRGELSYSGSFVIDIPPAVTKTLNIHAPLFLLNLYLETDQLIQELVETLLYEIPLLTEDFESKQLEMVETIRNKWNPESYHQFQNLWFESEYKFPPEIQKEGEVHLAIGLISRYKLGKGNQWIPDPTTLYISKRFIESLTKLSILDPQLAKDIFDSFLRVERLRVEQSADLLNSLESVPLPEKGMERTHKVPLEESGPLAQSHSYYGFLLSKKPLESLAKVIWFWEIFDRPERGLAYDPNNPHEIPIEKIAKHYLYEAELTPEGYPGKKVVGHMPYLFPGRETSPEFKELISHIQKIHGNMRGQLEDKINELIPAERRGLAAGDPGISRREFLRVTGAGVVGIQTARQRLREFGVPVPDNAGYRCPVQFKMRHFYPGIC